MVNGWRRDERATDIPQNHLGSLVSSAQPTTGVQVVRPPPKRLDSLTQDARRARAASPFKAGAKWETVRIPFSQLQPLRNSRNQNGAAWDPKKVKTMVFELAGAAGTYTWLQIDNIRFFR